MARIKDRYIEEMQGAVTESTGTGGVVTTRLDRRSSTEVVRRFLLTKWCH